MKYRPLGKSGLMVSEIAFGAWAIGGSMWGGRRDEEARAALARARQLGVNFIDTALVYGDGHSERLVGEFVRSNPGMMVATKVPPKSMQWPARANARLEDNFPGDWIRASCERSLANLGLERIDLLQLHVWAEAWTDSDEWYDAMVRLKEEGKIRLVGISINSHDPASAVRVARSGRVDALQVFYNVFDQSPEDELFPTCLEHGVGVLSRVPLDEGSLTGKFTESTQFPRGDFRRDYFRGPLLAETVRRVQALRPVLTGPSGATTMARGALRFCLSHKAVSTVIPGMRSAAQAEENCAASEDGALPAEVIDGLRAHRWVRGG
ncbi:MAG: aldo/keto reductase [Deltaproteobacteria bacterium]|nr:aldo/keto reductase [Deltaproteobacteria bacterium]